MGSVIFDDEGFEETVSDPEDQTLPDHKNFSPNHSGVASESESEDDDAKTDASQVGQYLPDVEERRRQCRRCGLRVAVWRPRGRGPDTRAVRAHVLSLEHGWVAEMGRFGCSKCSKFPATRRGWEALAHLREAHRLPQPAVSLLEFQAGAEAELAAEMDLAFQYRELQSKTEELRKNSKAEKSVRLAAEYARLSAGVERETLCTLCRHKVVVRDPKGRVTVQSIRYHFLSLIHNLRRNFPVFRCALGSCELGRGFASTLEIWDHCRREHKKEIAGIQFLDLIKKKRVQYTEGGQTALEEDMESGVGLADLRTHSARFFARKRALRRHVLGSRTK